MARREGMTCRFRRMATTRRASRRNRVQEGLARLLLPLALTSLAVEMLGADLAGAQEVETPEQTPAAESADEPGAEFSANPEIEELVVRARESEATRDFSVADSVTGFGAEDLEALGAQNIADIESALEQDTLIAETSVNSPAKNSG